MNGRDYCSLVGVAETAGDPGSIPRSGRSPEEGHGNPLFLPGESYRQRILAGYSPRGQKESNTTEGLTETKENQIAQVREFAALLCLSRGM